MKQAYLAIGLCLVVAALITYGASAQPRSQEAPELEEGFIKIRRDTSTHWVRKAAIVAILEPDDPHGPAGQTEIILGGRSLYVPYSVDELIEMGLKK